nr:sodium/glutamate symporter [Paraburkholderia aspalathi]
METLMAASLILLLGRQILARVRVLRTYTIPEPVVGGLLVALLVFAISSTLKIDVRFDTALQAPLMLSFFATIGTLGRTIVSAGAANYKGGSAAAAGATYRSQNGKWLINGAVSVALSGDGGVRAQVGYEF